MVTKADKKSFKKIDELIKKFPVKNGTLQEFYSPWKPEKSAVRERLLERACMDDGEDDE